MKVRYVSWPIMQGDEELTRQWVDESLRLSTVAAIRAFIFDTPEECYNEDCRIAGREISRTNFKVFPLLFEEGKYISTLWAIDLDAQNK